ncbi:MAG: hypothetical protein A2Y57_00920 [Candidatus Woykebacteria bacterium RBG_13_40_7b]|uniref:Uncharacterized protein n=1 Tax=Candidatus Woykebacteria bacterium RBG_13_40_7b TaxID=1802594 RepID=A0A1G1W9T6_9BACT|nr:MAG: hypothetical protein A2Y57_00920 [Candidatus Woykebacteria bacterium RBG_13_40_7b]
MEQEKAEFKGGLKVLMPQSYWRIISSNFLGGIAWGLGTVFGATLILALILYILSGLVSAPLIGDFITNIIENVTIPAK